MLYRTNNTVGIWLILKYTHGNSCIAVAQVSAAYIEGRFQDVFLKSYLEGTIKKTTHTQKRKQTQKLLLKRKIV